MDLSQLHGNSTSPMDGNAAGMDLKTLHKLDKIEHLFVESSSSSWTASGSGGEAVVEVSGRSMGSINPAAASRAAAAKFGAGSDSRASGRIMQSTVSMPSRNEGAPMASGATAAQVAAAHRQRRTSVTNTDASMTQDDILAR